MMATLKEQGTKFYSAKESELKPDEIRGSGAVFLFTDLPHNDVLEKHRTFRDFLTTSCLEPQTKGP